MPIRPRPEIERVSPVIHGGYHSTHSPDWVDFSSNVNPFGPSPRTWAAMQAAPIDRHPDPRAAPLRDLIAGIEDVDSTRVIVGNGSVDLIYHLAVAYLRAGDRVLIPGPTFGEYAAASAIMGAQVVSWRADPEADFALDLDALLDSARACNPRLIFLCNPNNPTGKYWSRAAVENILLACPESLVVLDQAFIRFVAGAWDSRPLRAYDNLILLRSMTKDYALTGLRVGYAIASSSIIQAIEKVQPPWSVNILAQLAGMAALRDEKYLTDSLTALAFARDDLVNGLTSRGMKPVPSVTHFFLLRVRSASDFSEQMRARSMVVRDGTSWGLPMFVRIAARRPEENARLLRAVEEIR